MLSSESAWSLGYTRAASLEQLQQGISPEPLFPRTALEPWGGYAAADPFALRVGEQWFVFFEMLIRAKPAVIAVASSRDLEQWEILGVCSTAPHHVSFPYVFEHEGAVYMVPESKPVRRIDLFRCVQFPLHWERCATLARGRYMDASIIKKDGRFWMLTGWHSYWLRLFYADHPWGPWRRHWMPFARAYCKANVRPAGGPVRIGSRWMRPVQDNRLGYGKQVRAMQITHWNRLWYAERPWYAEPILQPEGKGWYAQRLHHLDLHADAGGWLGFLDGCN
jgi:hypothetical protein